MTEMVKHRIMMISDFFYPNVGGVENHIYQLSQQLLLLGHKLVVVTHAYGNCRGVRYLTNGLKVYYLNRRPMYQQTTYPTLFGNMAMLRHLLLYEGITIVHAHQAFSVLALEAILHARTMGYPVVFTDHSLFGFADAGSILMNKALKCVLADVQHCICVSHTSRENTVLRACVPPSRVSVIPNAVDACIFSPPTSRGIAATCPASNEDGFAAQTKAEGNATAHARHATLQQQRQQTSLQKPVSEAMPATRKGQGSQSQNSNSLKTQANSKLTDGKDVKINDKENNEESDIPELEQGPEEKDDNSKPAAATTNTTIDGKGIGGPAPAWPRNGLEDPITVIMMCRLVYRKGLDLVALCVPHICDIHPNVRFLIGGGGPKTKLLSQMISQYNLEDRVTLVGPIPGDQAPEFLRRGHIFLNASLTEAFCMAIVEAAACGLMVVSTRVGGVPEVLPSHMVELCEPSAEGLCTALSTALRRVSHVQPEEQHKQVASMYSWQRVAERTVRVYDSVHKQHTANLHSLRRSTDAKTSTQAEPRSLQTSDTASCSHDISHKDTLQNHSTGGQLQAVCGATNHNRSGASPRTCESEIGASPGPVDANAPIHSLRLGDKNVAKAATRSGVDRSVQDLVCKQPLSTTEAAFLLPIRLARYVQCGRFMGPIMCVLIVWLHWWWCMLDCLCPAADIEPAMDWPRPVIAIPAAQLSDV